MPPDPDGTAGHAADEVRLTPLPPQSWPAEMRTALAPLRPPTPRSADQPKGLNALGTFARHPALMRAYHVFVGQLLYESSLSARQRELLILRVAAVRGADYEWAQHVVLATDAGISRAEMAAIAGNEPHAGWPPLETALLAAVDELLAAARISDATWSSLSAELSEHQLFDLVFTVGAYDVLAMALRSFGVPLDDDLVPWLTADSD
jgi:alkylhydroperoxidase family enzyme